MVARLTTHAVVMTSPGALELQELELTPPGPDDVVVEISYSGISTGTERLLWTGRMPAFPGMGYPLVPGYESVGRIVDAGPESGREIGQTVFVPGARCFGPVHGLFGGAAARLVLPGARTLAVQSSIGPQGVLLALAATAYSAVCSPEGEFRLPDLIVGHGVLGRLIARLTLALGGAAPSVWEIDPARRDSTTGYQVTAPDQDERQDYRVIVDVSGADGLLDTLIARLAPGGEIVLAGFYQQPVQFDFPPAFMRRLRLRVAAEWQPEQLEAVAGLIRSGQLSLDNLITDCCPANEARSAYEQAFNNPASLKVILDWSAFH